MSLLPDLGKYAIHVWLSYGATAVALIGLLLASLHAHRKTLRDLAAMESAREKDAHD